ncbi:MAG TPA: phosphoglucomutase/phosphomannomutase family protein [Terriglobales bacterium]|nr:phosphoglucomutase/phosphomannomutase family protein [Terriglobales bacterium]
MPDIKFGTDGWRGVIADDYTFENVRRAAGATASYILKNEDARKGVVVGYDTRFGSRSFARAAAEVLADAGIAVRFSNDYIPTPAISYMAKALDTAGGVMITSSHNPWSWNGFKFKEKFGGSARPAIIQQIEAELAAGAMPKGTRAKIEEMDFKPPYVAAITKFADLELIGRAGFKVAIDYMYGAGRHVLGNILRQRGVNVVEIRSEVNPLFPGINPEPIEPHVRMLQDTVLQERCHAGFANDGDADRIGAVAEDGSFVDAHKCYAILLWWLLEYKKWPGAVTRAFNTTRMLDRIAKKHGRELIEHGIGFKYVCDVVLSGKEVLIGGEESGGIGIPRHLPERDGVLNALLLANAMAESRMTLGEIVAHLQKEFGAHYYGRRDLHIAEDIKQAAIRRADSGDVRQLGSYRVLRKENLDGVKFFLDAPANGNGAEAWVLMRASGTEPLMRIYCEAASPELVTEILDAAVGFVEEKAAASKL